MYKTLVLLTMLAMGLLVMGNVGAVTLVYSGNLDGELEPCGCSEGGDLGGILRRSTLLQQLRQEQPDLIVISGGGLLANESARDRLKSRYILSGFQHFNYDAVALQWRDLAYGPEFLQQQAIPWVASNWGHSSEVVQQQRIQRGELDLAFFSWLDPKRSPFREMQGAHQVITDKITPVQQMIAKAKQQGALTVLTTTWPLKKVKKEFDLSVVDILLVRSAYEVFGEPKMEGSTLVLQPGSRGMRLGRVNFSYENSRVNNWSHQVMDMPSSIADDPALADWYQAYNADVKAAYLKTVAIKQAQESGESPFLGAEACQDCHGEIYEKWQDTLHAHAFEKLENVGKSFDPDCIVCHTVGFDQPGGYVDFSLTPQLMNVQCENCHGAGKQHVNSQGQTPMPHGSWEPEQMCRQCHVGSHSPDFNFEAYWPQISH